jgi:hypothetical protein
MCHYINAGAQQWSGSSCDHSEASSLSSSWQSLRSRWRAHRFPIQAQPHDRSGAFYSSKILPWLRPVPRPISVF